MPKPKENKVLPDIKEATSEFEFNTGFRYGLSDNPPQLDEVPMPFGAAGCLDGITFVITGTLPSLTREDARDLIERHGGRVTGSISGKTDFLLRGVIEVGPKKVEDAKKKNIRIIDQESLFEYLISTNPSWKPPPPKKVEGDAVLPTTNFPESSLLTEKYRPRMLKDVVGNYSGIKHLMKFFDDFVEKGDKGSVILSGPPGIGKSTCAALVALNKGYKPIEFNASDTRSKKSIGEDVADVFTNFSLGNEDGAASSGKLKRVCLIFDEIDGMSSGDRGGLQAFVKLVDKTEIPVICICNDRNNKKLQTLANHSVDIKFSKPSAKDICDRLQYIAEQEKIKATEQQLLDIAQASNGDIRHAINTLQFWTQNTSSNEDGDSISPADKDGKIVPLNDILDATQKALLPASTIDQRFEYYFVDYGIMPLYIYENLPAVEGYRQNYSEAIDSISLGDNVQNLIRDSNTWSLLNTDALFSTVIPGYESKGKGFGVSVRFPQWFGKTSKGSRLRRNCVDISSRMANASYVSPNNLYDTTGPLISAILKDISKKNKKDPEPFVKLLDSLCLTLDDSENLSEIVTLDGDFKKAVPPKLKTAIRSFYRTEHTDDQKKTKKLSDIQADYYISKRAKGSFSRMNSSKRKKRDDEYGDYDDDDDYDDYDESFGENEEEDEDYIPDQSKKTKTKKEKPAKKEKTVKKEKPAKSQPKPKPKSKSKKKSKSYSSEDDYDMEDDGSDLDGFIVSDDEYDETPKKKKTKKSSASTQKSNYKPKKTVVKKKK